MKHLILSLALAFALVGCKSSQYGSKVSEPFSGSKYESNKTWYRAVGKGSSSKDNIAIKKATIAARGELAGQINTLLKEVSDSYFSETGFGSNAETSEKLESLTRQVVNTEMADLRKFDEATFYKEETSQYTAFIAYEIKKKQMYKHLKKQIKLEAFEDKKLQGALDKYLEEQIEELEKED